MRGKAIFVVLTAFAAPLLAESPKCDYQHAEGRELKFAEPIPQLHESGYFLWSRGGPHDAELEHELYVGKKGKLLDSYTLLTDHEESYATYSVLLETCETVFYNYLLDRGERPEQPKEMTKAPHDTYFVDQFESVAALKGKTIWLNRNSEAARLKLYSMVDASIFELGHLEPLKVVDVTTKQFDVNAEYNGPFNLVLRKPTGETGYIPAWTDCDCYFTSDKINHSWPPKIVALIRQQKIAIGMSPEQAILSWGKPDKVNKTVTEAGVHEQWIYGEDQFLYFDNRKLKAFQSSK